MNKVKIITDSCSSLTQEEMKKLNVDYVQESFSVNNQEFKGFEHPVKDANQFYEELQKCETCSTSCINTQTFADIFEKYVKQGFDVFYIGLSSGLSCTYNNALIAAEEINQDNGKHVYVADSLSGSFAIAKMVEKAVELANEGNSAEQIYNILHENGLKTYTMFIPSDLQFLTKSGRISKLVANIGTLLNLIPILAADSEGKLKIVAKCIGRKKAMKTLQNLILQNADLSSPEKIYIGHTNFEEDAKEVAEFFKQNTQNKEIIIGNIDYTMGCCCGPKTLAVFATYK